MYNYTDGVRALNLITNKVCMKLGIYTNSIKDESFRHTREFLKLLKAEEIPFAVSRELSRNFPDEEIYESFEEIGMLVVFGGDGTLLRVAKQIAAYELPILGINLGTLGFLSEVENDQYLDCIRSIKRGDYRIEYRTMLEMKLNKKVYSALNEVTVSRENSPDSFHKVIRLEAYSNRNLIDRFVADGVIIATPTGSTAYSLSAGGPILMPSLNAKVITPIAAHSLHSRPVVLSDSEVVTIKLLETGCRVAVSVDGEVVQCVDGESSIQIVSAQHRAKFVRFPSTPNFYEKLLDKLNKWSTTL